jgi:hypothetical protein
MRISASLFGTTRDNRAGVPQDPDPFPFFRGRIFRIFDDLGPLQRIIGPVAGRFRALAGGLALSGRGFADFHGVVNFASTAFSELRLSRVLGGSRFQARAAYGGRGFKPTVEVALVCGVRASRTARVEADERLMEGPLARPNPAHQIEGEGGHEQQPVQRYRHQEDTQHDRRDGAVHHPSRYVHVARVARHPGPWTLGTRRLAPRTSPKHHSRNFGVKGFSEVASALVTPHTYLR